MTQPSQGGAITADGASAPISEDVAITSKNHSLPRRAASAVKSIASKLLTLELCVLVLLAAVVFGPQLFGIQTYGILTGSMEPAIQTGALTFVDTGVSGADLRPGDVAAFDIGEGRICAHRVVSVDPENQTITTKGDANATEDLNPVAFEDVFGKTVGSVPGLGQTPPIFEEVVVANLAEAQGQSGSKTITATGYGIQSEGLPDVETAWDAYKKQNGIGDGEPAEIPPVQWIRVKNGFSNMDRDPKNPSQSLAGTSFENSFGPLGDGSWNNTWYSLYTSAKSRWTGLPTCSSDVWGYSVHRCSSNYAENRKAEFPSNHVSGMTNNGVVCAVHYSDLSVIFIMPITYSKCSIEMPEQEKLTLLTRISGKPVYGYFSEKLQPVPVA